MAIGTVATIAVVTTAVSSHMGDDLLWVMLPQEKPSEMLQTAGIAKLAMLLFGLIIKSTNSPQTIADKAKAVAEVMQKAYAVATQAIKDGIQDTEEAVASVAQKVAEIAKDLIEDIKEALANISKEAAEAFKEFTQAVKDTVQKWWDVVKDFFDDFANPDYPDTLPREVAMCFPDWDGINRSGFHYFYDSLVLDLDGDGVKTIAHNKFIGAILMAMVLPMPQVGSKKMMVS